MTAPLVVRLCSACGARLLVPDAPGLSYCCHAPLVGETPPFGLVQSEGGKFDGQRDEGHPTARVFLNARQLEREGYEDDAPAIMGDLRVGLVYHGQKKMRGPLAKAVR